MEHNEKKILQLQPITKGSPTHHTTSKLTVNGGKSSNHPFCTSNRYITYDTPNREKAHNGRCLDISDTQPWVDKGPEGELTDESLENEQRVAIGRPCNVTPKCDLKNLNGFSRHMSKALVDKLYSFSDDKDGPNVVSERVENGPKIRASLKCALNFKEAYRELDGPVSPNVFNEGRTVSSSYSPNDKGHLRTNTENDIEKLIGMSSIFGVPKDRFDFDLSGSNVNGFKRRYTLPLVQVGCKTPNASLSEKEDKTPEVGVRRCKYSIDAILEKAYKPSEKGLSDPSEKELEFIRGQTERGGDISHPTVNKFESNVAVCGETAWTNNLCYSNKKLRLDLPSTIPCYNTLENQSSIKHFPIPYHPLNNYLFSALGSADYSMLNNGFDPQNPLYRHPYNYYLLNLFNYGQHGFGPRVAPYYAPAIHPNPLTLGLSGLHKKSYHHQTFNANNHHHAIHPQLNNYSSKHRHNRNHEAASGTAKKHQAATEDNTNGADASKPTKKRGSKIQFFNDWRLERDKCGRFTKQNNYTSHRKELLEKLRKGITLRCELCGQTFHSLKGYIDHENKLPCMRRSTSSGKKRGRPRKIGEDPVIASPHSFHFGSKVNGSPPGGNALPTVSNVFKDVRKGEFINSSWLLSPLDHACPIPTAPNISLLFNKINLKNQHCPPMSEISTLTTTLNIKSDVNLKNDATYTEVVKIDHNILKQI